MIILEGVNPIVVHHRFGVLRVPVGADGAPATDPVVKLTRPGAIALSGSISPSADDHKVPFSIVRPGAIHGEYAQQPAKLRMRFITGTPDGAMLCNNGSAVAFWRDGAEAANVNKRQEEDTRILGPDREAVVRQIDACTSNVADIPDNGLALTFSASSLPGLAAPGAPPHFPSAYYHAGNEARVGNAAHAATAPRETWLVLEHLTAGGAVIVCDVALFTVAPIIFSSDIDPPDQLIAVYYADDAGEVVQEVGPPTQTCKPGNYGFLADLIALAAPALPAVPPEPPPDVVDSSDDEAQPEPPKPFCILTTDPKDPDPWAQDALHVGYSHGPGPRALLYYAISARRPRSHSVAPYRIDGMRGQWLEDLRPDNYAVDNSQNYGGNIVVSPPIGEPTGAVQAGNAGPAITAHPAAPYGKIILSCAAPGMTARRPDSTMLGFLRAQCVQPLVPIDVGALRVGHADEVVGFVKSNAGLGWVMTFAAPALVCTLLDRLWRIDNFAACVHRWPRRRTGDPVCTPVFFDDVADVAKVYELEAGDSGLRAKAGTAAFTARLGDILARLRAELRLGDADFLRVPVAFSAKAAAIEAQFPDMVNMQVFGERLAVPKPWGPRVTRATARTVLAGVEGLTVGGLEAMDFAPLLQERIWLGPHQTRDATVRDWVADTYALGDVTPAADPPEVLAEAVQKGKGSREGWRTFTATWNDSVCLFEAYMFAKLQAIGQTPSFIDDWTPYFIAAGEIHCGTKVGRRRPVVADGSAWWRNYADYLALDQDF